MGESHSLSLSFERNCALALAFLSAFVAQTVSVRSYSLSVSLSYTARSLRVRRTHSHSLVFSLSLSVFLACSPRCWWRWKTRQRRRTSSLQSCKRPARASRFSARRLRDRTRPDAPDSQRPRQRHRHGSPCRQATSRQQPSCSASCWYAGCTYTILLSRPLLRCPIPCPVAPPPATSPHPLPFRSTPCPIVRPPALSLLTRPCRSQSEPARRRGAGPAACLCPHQGRRTDPERWARVTLGGPRGGISARPGRPPASPRAPLRGAAGRAADPHHRASELLRPRPRSPRPLQGLGRRPASAAAAVCRGRGARLCRRRQPASARQHGPLRPARPSLPLRPPAPRSC